MLKTMLVGLDGTAASDSTLELAIRWARQYDALLVGLGIVDEPGIRLSEELVMAETYFRPVNEGLVSEARHKVERSLSVYARRCAEAGVAYKPLEDVGTPFVQILREAQRYDLVMLGQETHFRYGWTQESDETLGRVLGDCPRPVVAVPTATGDGKAVLIAYDGSLQAARAVQSFVSLGLADGHRVRVVTVDSDAKAAARTAERAVDFLHSHGIRAESSLADRHGSIAEVLLERVHADDAGLVVMGAYGQPVLREFFLGSTTRTMVRECPVPLFLTH